MLTIETAQGTSLPINWIGISELDGKPSLRDIGAQHGHALFDFF